MDDTGRGVIGGRAAASRFTTFREGSLHAALKEHCAATITDARVEADVDGFVVDVAGRDEVVEIPDAKIRDEGQH